MAHNFIFPLTAAGEGGGGQRGVVRGGELRVLGGNRLRGGGASTQACVCEEEGPHHHTPEGAATTQAQAGVWRGSGC